MERGVRLLDHLAIECLLGPTAQEFRSPHGNLHSTQIPIPLRIPPSQVCGQLFGFTAAPYCHPTERKLMRFRKWRSWTCDISWRFPWDALQLSGL